MNLLSVSERPSAEVREFFDFAGRCLPGEIENRSAAKSSIFHPYLRMEDGAFCISGDNANVIHLAVLATETGGDPMGTGCSRGTRSCLQGLVCYTFCDRRHGKGCCPAFGGIAFRAAGSGRDRPAHRQRPAAVRKRTGRNLRAVISEKILFRPGRRRYIKSPVPAAADKYFFQKSPVRNKTDPYNFEITLVLQWAVFYTTLGSEGICLSAQREISIDYPCFLILTPTARSSASENKYQNHRIIEPH